MSRMLPPYVWEGLACVTVAVLLVWMFVSVLSFVMMTFPAAAVGILLGLEYGAAVSTATGGVVPQWVAELGILAFTYVFINAPAFIGAVASEP